MPNNRPHFASLLEGRAGDLVVILGLFMTDTAAQGVVAAGGHASSAPIGPGPVLVAAACAGCFWWRRQRPIMVLVAVLVAEIGAAGVVPPGLLSQHTGIPLALAAYACGSWAIRRWWATAIPALVMMAVFLGVSSKAAVINAAAAALAVIALPWVAGQAVRSRRLYVEQVERRLAEAVRERDQRSARAVLDERRRMARELHDVVAHHVSLIGVQAGAARVALDAAPDTTRRALLAIEQSSRDAVGEMRQLLDVLRPDALSDGTDPHPGLDRLDALVAGFTQAGLAITTRLRGDHSQLSPILDLCCYRIVEEALTNVARHSAARHASVDINVAWRGPHGSPSVDIRVVDGGPARRGTSGGGRGLIGIRERVALFGGELTVGPTTTGAFEVAVSIDEPGTA